MSPSEDADYAKRSMQPKLTPIKDDWALVCHDCGYTDPEAFVIGPCPGCGSARTSAEPSHREKHSEVTDAETARFVRLHTKSNLSIREIAERVGRDPDTVRAHVGDSDA